MSDSFEIPRKWYASPCNGSYLYPDSLPSCVSLVVSFWFSFECFPSFFLSRSHSYGEWETDIMHIDYRRNRENCQNCNLKTQCCIYAYNRLLAYAYSVELREYSKVVNTWPLVYDSYAASLTLWSHLKL